MKNKALIKIPQNLIHLNQQIYQKNTNLLDQDLLELEIIDQFLHENQELILNLKCYTSENLPTKNCYSEHYFIFNHINDYNITNNNFSEINSISLNFDNYFGLEYNMLIQCKDCERPDQYNVKINHIITDEDQYLIDISQLINSHLDQSYSIL